MLPLLLAVRGQCSWPQGRGKAPVAARTMLAKSRFQPGRKAISTERRQEHRRARPLVAYFSMETGLENDVPTYSGGLGILAGDTLRAGADLGLPMVAVTLVHRSGYFRQIIRPEGLHREEPAVWSPEAGPGPFEIRAQIELEGQPVILRALLFTVKGDSRSVAVSLLDTDLEENSEAHRGITHQLYG